MLEGYISLARQANILSFDEVRARDAASSSRRVPTRSSARPSHFPEQHNRYRGQTPTSGYSSMREGRFGASSGHSAGSASGYAARSSRQYNGTSAGRQHYAGSRQGTYVQTASSYGRADVHNARTFDRQSDQERASRSGNRASEPQQEDFVKVLRKRFRTAKADRAFEKTIGARDRAKEQQAAPGSRAALYEMRMGSTHRKSAQMQESGKKARFGAGFSLPLPLLNSRMFSRAVVAFSVLAFAVVMLYGPCASLYNETRSLQQLEAEYAALEDANAQMQSQLDYLNTDEGLEDYARAELGWVRADEQVVAVEGVEVENANSEAKTSVFVQSVGTVPTPSTWYSGIGDIIFGYGG